MCIFHQLVATGRRLLQYIPTAVEVSYLQAELKGYQR